MKNVLFWWNLSVELALHKTRFHPSRIFPSSTSWKIIFIMVKYMCWARSSQDKISIPQEFFRVPPLGKIYSFWWNLSVEFAHHKTRFHPSRIFSSYTSWKNIFIFVKSKCCVCYSQDKISSLKKFFKFHLSEKYIHFGEILSVEFALHKTRFHPSRIFPSSTFWKNIFISVKYKCWVRSSQD